MDSQTIDRRTFLRYGAYATAMTAAAPTLGSIASVPHAAAQASFEWEEATIADLQAAMESGALTALVLTRAFIGRIEAMDFSGPQLNSVIEVNPDAEAIASTLDEERTAGQVRGPLHGIPVLLKDTMATDDRMETTAGSQALLGSKVPRDSGVATKLREAGAVILGKANMGEWSMMRNVQTSWSARAGQCLNPYVLTRTPHGSSSGSAAAVSANFATGALGGDFFGSVVNPAAACGIVGIRPTHGLVTQSGVIIMTHSREVIGPMCRTVADVATMLGALVGVDPLDPATNKSVGHSQADYREFLDPDGLRGARIGIWRQAAHFGDHFSHPFANVIPALRDLGATVVETIEIPHWQEIFTPYFQMNWYECKRDLARYLSGLANTNIRNLADIIAFNDENADRELTWADQGLFEIIESFGATRPEYLDALRTSTQLARGGISSPMMQHRLDAIVAPTVQAPWTIDLVNGDTHDFGSTGPSQAAGWPSLTVPVGYVGELPIGITFMARAWEEPKLLQYAYAFEQHVHARHAPKFLDGYGVRDFVAR